MKTAKTFNGAVHFNDGMIYAVGGNDKDGCERFDSYSSKWENLASYADIIQSSKTNELNGWCQLYVPLTPQIQ